MRADAPKADRVDRHLVPPVADATLHGHHPGAGHPGRLPNLPVLRRRLAGLHRPAGRDRRRRHAQRGPQRVDRQPALRPRRDDRRDRPDPRRPAQSRPAHRDHERNWWPDDAAARASVALAHALADDRGAGVRRRRRRHLGPRTHGRYGRHAGHEFESGNDDATDRVRGRPRPIICAAARDAAAARRPTTSTPPTGRTRCLPRSPATSLRVYVPNHGSNTVSVIDPATYTVIRTVRVPAGPQHVVPSWDLRTLWVNNDTGNALTPIDPATGTIRHGRSRSTTRTTSTSPRTEVRRGDVRGGAPDRLPRRAHHGGPQGRPGRLRRRQPRRLLRRRPVLHRQLRVLRRPAQGRHRAAAGHRPAAPAEQTRCRRTSRSPRTARPGTSRTCRAPGVWILDGDRFTTPTFLPTGDGAHGLYVSRDSKRLLHHQPRRGHDLRARLRHRQAGRQVEDPRPRDARHGRRLRGRHGAVAVRPLQRRGLRHRHHDRQARPTIPVGAEPHGLCVWPQPGRYSLGHTGILR